MKLCKPQPFGKVLFKEPHPVDGVQPIPSVMTGTHDEIVERFVPDVEGCPADNMAPLQSPAALDCV
jgi:hypothetical protein